MKLKEYAKHIAALAKKHPTLEVAYASDDEGNSYHYVRYAPASTEVEVNGEDVFVVVVN